MYFKNEMRIERLLAQIQSATSMFDINSPNEMERNDNWRKKEKTVKYFCVGYLLMGQVIDSR